MNLYNYLGNKLPVNVLNVKDYGAVGNGTTDDASAIQEALDSARQAGGIIYFPVGTYLLTTGVVFYSNQALIFAPGATLLQGGEINNLLRSYTEAAWTGYTGVHDVLIYGGTFDGGNYETNNTLVGIAHCKNITFERCTFKNAYGTWHNLEVNSSCNVNVKDCIFEGSRKTGDHGELIQVDACSSGMVYPWGPVSYDGTVCTHITIDECIFADNAVAPAIGNHGDNAHEYVTIRNCLFDGTFGSRGAINFVQSMTDIDIHDNTFIGCTKGIGSSGTTYYIHDNRFVDVTTAISGSDSVAHENMINGTYTA